MHVRYGFQSTKIGGEAGAPNWHGHSHNREVRLFVFGKSQSIIPFVVTNTTR